LSSETFTLPAFAKINWSLRVLGRRTDGYHELNTIFQTVDLHDNITFTDRTDETISLSCDDAGIPLDIGNLIVRAAEALRRRYGIRNGAAIHLEKRIPAGGGLGGGSSDAAVALLGLARLWRIEAGKSALEEIGASLGADVPFFFTGGTALGVGIGTEISSLPDAPLIQLLIVTPHVQVSTANAYKALNSPALTKVGGDIILSSSRSHVKFPYTSPSDLRNDFERVIFNLYPEIMRARDGLKRAGARVALLAGSGASVFGIFDDAKAQQRAAEVLSTQHGWHVSVCETLSHRSYLKALGSSAAPLIGEHSRVQEFDTGA
jgi:4-diphosphocytidyl-2-C-methyl-D-erythritol kinase